MWEAESGVDIDALLNEGFCTDASPSKKGAADSTRAGARKRSARKARDAECSTQPPAAAPGGTSGKQFMRRRAKRSSVDTCFFEFAEA